MHTFIQMIILNETSESEFVFVCVYVTDAELVLGHRNSYSFFSELALSAIFHFNCKPLNNVHGHLNFLMFSHLSALY